MCRIGSDAAQLGHLLKWSGPRLLSVPLNFCGPQTSATKFLQGQLPSSKFLDRKIVRAAGVFEAD